MPAFWAINRPKPVTPSPAETNSAGTFMVESKHQDSIPRPACVLPAQGADTPIRFNHQSTATPCLILSSNPQMDLVTSESYSTGEASPFARNAESSNLRASKRNKRRKAKDFKSKTSSSRTVENGDGSKKLTSKDPQTKFAASDRVTEAEALDRVSEDSGELSDLNTLLLTSNRIRESRRVMPNRAKKVLPSIEKSPDIPGVKYHLEVRIPEKAYSLTPRWDEDVVWDVDMSNGEKRGQETYAALFREPLKNDTDVQFSSLTLKDPVKGCTGPTSGMYTGKTGDSDLATRGREGNDTSRVNEAPKQGPRFDNESTRSESNSVPHMLKVCTPLGPSSDVEAFGRNETSAPHESLEIPSTPTPPRFSKTHYTQGSELNVISRPNNIPVQRRHDSNDVFPRSVSSNFSNSAATPTSNQRAGVEPTTATALHTAIYFPFPVTLETRQAAVAVKDEPQSRFLTATPTMYRHRNISNKLPMPQTYSPRTRRRKLKDDGVVEQPREEYSLEMIEYTHRQLRNIEKYLGRLLLDKTKGREHKAEEAKKLGDKKRDKQERRERKMKTRRKAKGHSGDGNEYLNNSALTGSGNAASSRNATVVDPPPSVAQKTHSACIPGESGLVSAKAKSTAVDAPALMNNAHAITAKTANTCALSVQELEPKSAQRSDDALQSQGAASARGQASKEVRTGPISIGKEQQTAPVASRSTNPRVLPGVGVCLGATGAKSRNGTISERETQRQAGRSVDDHQNAPASAQCPDRPTFQRPRGFPSAPSYLQTPDISRGQGSSRGTTFPITRREFVSRNDRPRCVCDHLHDYFRQAWSFEPRLDNFPGCKAEFLAHAEQIVHCRAHSKTVRDVCQMILEEETLSNSVGSQGPRPSFNTNTRAQSIIPPSEFYGFRNSRSALRPNNTESEPPSCPPHKRNETAVCRERARHGSISGLESISPPSPKPRKATTATTAIHRNAERPFDPMPREKKASDRTISPGQLMTSPLRSLPNNARFRRHQSLPARTIREERHSVAGTERNAGSTKHELEFLVDAMVRKRLAEQVAPAAEARIPEDPASKKRKLSTAERKMRDPPLPKDVPMRRRMSDAQLLHVAALINPYERHRRAPYAFRYNGKLYAEYKHLRVAVGNNGRPALSAEELSRL